MLRVAHEVRGHRVEVPGLLPGGAGGQGAPGQVRGLLRHSSWQGSHGGERAGRVYQERDGQEKADELGLSDSYPGG